jgi:tetratricopeptide (TPR) repeat protein
VAANERGIGHLLANRIGPALDAFRQAHELLPGNATVARNLAAAHAARGVRELRAKRAESGVSAFQNARELHPTRIRYRVLLARAYIELGRDGSLLSARDELKVALDSDPDHLEALILLADLDYRDRRLDDGARGLERAFDLRPGDSDVRERLARMNREREVEEKYHTIRGGVFIVRYAPAIPDSRAEAVRNVCAKAWTDICTRFGHHPEGQIVVTLYPPRDFRKATRLHGWVAGVSDGTIRLTVSERTDPKALRSTLRHELTHHVIRDFAPRTPVWLHEGLAQLVEGDDPERSARRLRPREPVKDLSKVILENELDRSILAERDPRRVTRFYDLALAFTYFVQQRSNDRGIQELLQAMRDGANPNQAIEKVYGVSRSELFADWLRKLQDS